MDMKEEAVLTEEQTGASTETQDQTLGEGVGCERIRRITGYLVGTMDKWNDTKRAEERDRVKHDLA